MKIKVGPTELTRYLPAHHQATATVVYPSDDLSVEEFLDELVRPVMLALGYPQSVVDRIELLPGPEEV
jgi:hypothetical protein